MKHSSPKLPVAHLRRDPLAESPVALPGRTPSRRRWCAAAGLALALASAFASTTAWGAWQDSRAKLRFDVSLRQPPTHPSAGYFLVLPDGGVLPRPKPSVVVLSADGSSLESRILWWNSDQGLAIVFAQPPRGRDVHIYLRSAAVLRTWEPDCGLTPSPILCADPGAATLRDAEVLGRFGEVPDDVRCWRYEGHPQSALSIPGDLAGRPSPAAFYLQAYVAPRTAGKTWIAPFTHKGVSEVIVAGRKIEPWKRVEKWGGTGDYVELDAGIQRVELLAACPPGHYFSHGPGVMWFTWAPPDATIGELGGARPTSAPLPGTSKWASRVLRGEEVVRSGTASIEQVVTRDGAPVAMFTANPTHTYWFGDETPIVRFEFQAHTAGQPDGTNYRWTFGDDASVTGATAARLLPGATYAPVSLTADLGGNRSRSMQRIYTYSTAQTSLERAADREAYRQTFLAMLQAAPERSNPVTEWNDSIRAASPPDSLQSLPLTAVPRAPRGAFSAA